MAWAGDQHGKNHQASAYTPDKIQWGGAPPGLPAGMQSAVLLGDPGQPEDFVLRAKMPDGYVVPPHWHPIEERITILSGSLKVGTGDKMEEGKMTAYPTGSFLTMPAEMRHYVKASGETIIQIAAQGPFQITYVNPKDDPRQTAAKK